MNAHHIVQQLTDAEDTKNICLTVVLRSGEHEIEALLQTDGHSTWSLCGGHQQDDETAEEAAARELKEESGIDTPVEHLIDLKNHALRGKPAKVFCAVVDSSVEAKAGSDAEEVRWVPVTALGGLNDDDTRLIRLAVKRVHDPEALVKEAIETSQFSEPGMTAEIAPRGTQGVLVALEGEDIIPHAKALAEHLRERKLPHLMVNGNLSLVAETALESAHRLRKLNPITEAIIKAADALHRWEQQVKPALDAGQIVICEHWIDHDRKACLRRGLEPELFEALFRFLPKPDITLQINGESTEQVINRFTALAEDAPEMDPESYFNDFVDKGAATFHIIKSGEHNVYGAAPFRLDGYLAYSNDPEPPGGWKLPQGPGCHAHLGPDWKGETRTFEGYMFPTIDGKWQPVLNWKKVVAAHKRGRPIERIVSEQDYDTPEEAAYALWRYNRRK